MKYIKYTLLLVAVFFVALTAFGPWKTYHIDGGFDGLSGHSQVGGLPTWIGEPLRYFGKAMDNEDVREYNRRIFEINM